MGADAHGRLSRAIGEAAADALLDELALEPKPGLVSPADSGSHDDMDAATFRRSAAALRPTFVQAAAAGAAGAPFARLEAWGISAEARMLAATGGINTHRGAVFVLGLLCAAAGALRARGATLDVAAVRTTLHLRWGAALAARADAARTSNGRAAARRFALRAAGEEAALAFPTLFEHVVPAWQAARRLGLDDRRVRLHALFAAIATLDDTTLVQRGGLAGLHHARRCARAFLADGGARRADAFERARALHRDFVARRLSPGGAADMLAAACWLERVQEAA